MAPTRGRYTSIIVDHAVLDGQSNNVEIQIQNGVIDVTPFQVDGRTFLAEPPQGSIRHNGYLSVIGGSQPFEGELQARLGLSTSYVTVLLDTTVVACPAYVIHGSQADSMQISAPATNVVTIQGNWIAAASSAAGIKRGVRMFSGALTSTGAQTHIDLGGPGLDGYAYLHVNGIGGTATNATVTVQSDDNTGFSSATTHGTFTFSSRDGYAMTITGVIDRYARVNLTSLGGATSLTLYAVIVSGGVTM